MELKIPTVEDLMEGRIPVNKNVFQRAKESYNKMISNFTKLLQIQDIYSEPIETSIISPHLLNHRFLSPDTKRVRLIKTCTEEAINQRISECFENGNHKIYIHGPDGIGKSHALLAHALRVRKDPRSICVYTNDPGHWIPNEYYYIIEEIMYALIPFRQELSADNLLDSNILQGEDPLFKWYYLIKYTYAAFAGSFYLEPCLKDIFSRLKTAILELGEGLNMLWISDEENNWGYRNSTEFPYNLRFNFFQKVILSASPHYQPNKVPGTFKCEAVFVRLPGLKVISFFYVKIF